MSGIKSVDNSLAVLDPVPMEEAFGEIDEMAVDTYRLFLSSTEPMLAEIRAHLHAGKGELATDIAHSAKGAARMTGAFRLAAVYAHIETDSKQGDLSSALEWAALVPPAFEEVRQAIGGVARGLNLPFA